MPASGAAVATPLAKANADAACPEGNDRVTGILTWRPIGTR